MANKKKQEKYSAAPAIRDPTPNSLVLQAVYNYYRSRPDLYNVLPDATISTLEQPRMVQSMVKRARLSLWKGFRDYFKQGQYLGRITVNEGEIISMELL